MLEFFGVLLAYVQAALLIIGVIVMCIMFEVEKYKDSKRSEENK